MLYTNQDLVELQETGKTSKENIQKKKKNRTKRKSYRVDFVHS